MILVGSPKRANKIRDWLLAKRAYGFQTVGILTEDQHVPNAWPAILGPPAQLDAILSQYEVTQVILLQLPEATSGFDDLLRIVHKTRDTSDYSQQFRRATSPSGVLV
jgi:hypothetical protein